MVKIIFLLLILIMIPTILAEGGFGFNQCSCNCTSSPAINNPEVIPNLNISQLLIGAGIVLVPVIAFKVLFGRRF